MSIDTRTVLLVKATLGSGSAPQSLVLLGLALFLRGLRLRRILLLLLFLLGTLVLGATLVGLDQP